jgi:flavin reductase (DIM6/NTAB) family NADH-FMN oxidoreductase RutF
VGRIVDGAPSTAAGRRPPAQRLPHEVTLSEIPVVPVSTDLFRSALSRLASGISVISTAQEGERRGLTATAVCSVSAEPPTILVCVNTATGTAKMMKDKGWFAVSLVSEAHRGVAEVFAGRNSLAGDARFLHGDWVEGENEALPVLSGALASLECRVTDVVVSGTHEVFFGLVEAIRVKDGVPLIYHGGGFHLLPQAAPTATETLSQHSPAPAAR